MPRPSDQYDDANTQAEAPPQQKQDDGAIPGVPKFVDKTKGTRWQGTDETATTKKKGRR